MKGFFRAPFLIGTMTLALSPAPTMAGGPPQPLTECNQNVEGDVYLTGDLDCTGIVNGFGVNLMKRATLNLNGYSILNAHMFAVQCFKRCDIVGPGSIVGSGGGIWAPKKVEVVDVGLVDNGLLGIGSSKLTMIRTSVDGSRQGVTAGVRAELVDSSVTNSGWTGLRVSASFPSGSGPCTHGKLRMTNSTVMDNGLDALGEEWCDNGECVDVVTCREPRLDETSSCGISRKENVAETWGVCALD
jgi:hypothetical protein